MRQNDQTDPNAPEFGTGASTASENNAPASNALDAETSGTTRGRVFISYAREDRQVAEDVRARLVASGFDAFVDFEDIKVGEDWRKRLADLIASAEHVVYLISPNSVTSAVCAWEIDSAEGHGKTVLPVVIRDTELDIIPGRMRRLHFISRRSEGEREASDAQLVEALSTDLAWEREKTRINELATTWKSMGQPRRRLLSSEEQVREAETWRDSHPETALAPTELQKAFIAKSRGYLTKRQRWAVAASLGVALITAVLGAAAFVQREAAIEERDRALTTQSLFLADLAEQRLAAGDAAAAVLLSLEALPDEAPGADGAPLSRRPYVAEAERSLHAARKRLHETAVLPALSGWVMSVASSPQGDLIATAHRNGDAKLWSVAGELKATLVGHDAAVLSIAFSTDGDRIITASDDGAVMLWDVSGELLDRFAATSSPGLNSASFDAEGNRILTASDDAVVQIFDLSGKRLRRLAGHDGAVREAVFSADGLWIATASEDGTVKLWNEDDTPAQTFDLGNVRVDSVAFSPDGSHIVAGASDGVARIWSRDGEPIAALSGHCSSDRQIGAIGCAIWSVEFGADGKTIATGSSDGAARLWAVDGELLEVFVGHCPNPEDVVTFGCNVWDVSFASGGTQLLSGSSDGTARRWNLEPDARPVVEGHYGGVEHVAFSPDRGFFVTTSDDTTVKVWRPDGALFRRLDHHAAPVVAVAFHPSGASFATADAAGEAWIWTIDGEPIAKLIGHADRISRLKFSADGDRLVTASNDGQARVWRRDGEAIAILEGHQSWVIDAFFSENDATIITASADGGARVWSQDGAHVAEIAPHRDAIVEAAYSAESRRLLLGYADGSVWLVSDDGGLLSELLGHSAEIVSLAFSPDGAQILTASSDGTVLLWDGDGRSHTALDVGDDAALQVAALNPSGDRIITGDDEGSILIWAIDSGEPVAIERAAHADAVTNVAFSASGDRMVSAAADGGIALHRAYDTTQALVENSKLSVPRCLSPAERRAAFLPSAPPRWCITGPGAELEDDQTNWAPKYPYAGPR